MLSITLPGLLPGSDIHGGCDALVIVLRIYFVSCDVGLLMLVVAG